MPEMDGYEATARDPPARGEPGSRASRSSRMTANAMEGDRERCLAAGMDDYLPKPIETDAVLRALEQWAGRPAPEAVS